MAVWPTKALPCLFFIIERKHSEDDRYRQGKIKLKYTISNCTTHIIEMWSATTYYCAQSNDGFGAFFFVFIALPYVLTCKRQFETTGHSNTFNDIAREFMYDTLAAIA